MPSQQSHKSNNFWYSYDVGMAHFISLDTETDLGHGERSASQAGDGALRPLRAQDSLGRLPTSPQTTTVSTHRQTHGHELH